MSRIIKPLHVISQTQARQIYQEGLSFRNVESLCDDNYVANIIFCCYRKHNSDSGLDSTDDEAKKMFIREQCDEIKKIAIAINEAGSDMPTVHKLVKSNKYIDFCFSMVCSTEPPLDIPNFKKEFFSYFCIYYERSVRNGEETGSCSYADLWRNDWAEHFSKYRCLPFTHLLLTTEYKRYLYELKQENS